MKDKVCGAEYSSGWGLEKSYILGPWTDETICFVDRTAASDPPPRYYFTKDRLNSTRELINASATVVTSYDYDVWGTPTESHLSGNISTRYRHMGTGHSATLEMSGSGDVLYDPCYARRVKSLVWSRGGRVRLGRSHGYALIAPGLARDAALKDCVFGYCEENRLNCMEACWQDNKCACTWTMGLCAHCCMCYSARCFWRCTNGYDWLTGEPYFGKSEDAVEACHNELCGVPDVAIPPYFGDERDDSVVNPGNVCGSEYKTHTEWNAVWYAHPARYTLPPGLPFWLSVCRAVCWYNGEEPVFNLPLRSDPWAGKEHGKPGIAIHDWECCPSIIPATMSEEYEEPYFRIRGKNFDDPASPDYDPSKINIWGGEWLAWSSCPRTLIYGR